MKAVDKFYASRGTKLTRKFDRMARRARNVLVSNLGEDLADTVTVDAREIYRKLLPELPYIGGGRNAYTAILIVNAMSLALYEAMKRHGKGAEETGKIFYEAAEARFQAYPGWLLRLIGRLLFAKVFQKAMARKASKSQERRYPGDWIFTFVEGDGIDFDFGMDITECGVCKFHRAQGAEEFTKYLCPFDFAQSRVMGVGLVRTTTLAEGGDKCDFRFKKGRETQRGWPPEFMKCTEP